MTPSQTEAICHALERARHWQRWLVMYAVVASLTMLWAIAARQPLTLVASAYWWVAARLAQEWRNRALDRLRQIETLARFTLTIEVDDRASEPLERLAEQLRKLGGPR